MKHFQVSFGQLTKDGQYGSNTYCTEASDIGLRAQSHWPLSLEVNGLGNGLPFILTEQLRQGGEFIGGKFTQQFGCCSIIVYND